MRRLRILTLCSIVLSVAIFFLKKRQPTTIAAGDGLVISREWLQLNNNPVTPAKDVRPADQTFLTFPEWYLVFSPEEQATYFRKYTASTFPYMSHTAQIWQSYKIVNDQIKDVFPVNKGYQFMIWVIGSSASVEYAIKAWYETIVGRITDTHQSVAEGDRFNAKYTQDYVDFIKDNPWYEFDFTKRLNDLWTSTPLTGPHFLREIERRYFLTTELAVKTGYGQLIKMGTKSIYEDPLPTSMVLVDSLPQQKEGIRIVQQYGDGSALVSLPRYDKFNPAICDLAGRGCRFREIAGNTSAIVVSVLAAANTIITDKNAQVVFTQPVASDRTRKRMVIAVRVHDLSQLLNGLAREKIQVEHVFDY
jgi:hypothetical protein